jgi:hypothetical protein
MVVFERSESIKVQIVQKSVQSFCALLNIHLTGIKVVERVPVIAGG